VWPDDAAFWGWLTVLARSALSDQNRQRRRYLAFLERFAWLSRPNGPAPDSCAADAGLAGLLEKNLAALPADEREVVELKYFEHLPVREIAARLQVSEKAVESRLVRIRGKLKSAMLEGLKDE
jgi:RNA polymerase sigma-70 factor (ECF subfamily)